MSQDRGPYRRQCKLEDMQALLYDCFLTLEVCIAHARPIGNRTLLGELYRLRRQMERAKYEIMKEWQRETVRQHES